MLEFQSLAGSAFFASVPVLVALYMLKLNRRTVRIPSVVFIRRLTSENRGSSLFKRLTANVLLFIETVFLILLTLALMNPGFTGMSAVSKTVVLLVDSSITMSAMEAGEKTRLALAKEEAAKVVAANPNSSFAVISFSDRPALLLPPENSRPEIHSAVRSIRVSHRAPDHALALSLAEGVAAEGARAEVHVFSDFASAGQRAKIGPTGKVDIFYHPVGSRTKNAGVVEADVSAGGEGGTAYHKIFFSVNNYGDSEISVPVSVTADGRVLHRSVMTIPPSRAEVKVLRKYGGMPREVEVSIAPSDPLPADDTRVVRTGGGETYRALVVSEKPYFYKTALESVPGVSVDACDPAVPKSIYRSREYDLVAIDDTVEAAAYARYRSRNFILFAPPDGVAGVSYGGEVMSVTVKTPSVPFEYLRGVELSDLYVHTMKRAVSTGNFSEIVYGSAGAPIFMRSFLGSSNVFMTLFDPRLSNFPLKVGFPVFFSNVVGICRTSDLRAENFTAGADNYIRSSIVPPSQGALRIAGPEGFAAEFPSSPAGAERNLVKLPALELAGRYFVSSPSSRPGAEKEPFFTFYANPPSGKTLAIRPGKPPAAASAGDAAPAFESTHVSMAPLMIVLALAVLLVDWIYQNFRTFYGGERGR